MTGALYCAIAKDRHDFGAAEYVVIVGIDVDAIVSTVVNVTTAATDVTTNVAAGSA
jgi:hypothetical protein